MCVLVESISEHVFVGGKIIRPEIKCGISRHFNIRLSLGDPPSPSGTSTLILILV